MSRIIVKNLPSGIKEERVRSIFGKLGQITDCSLKYTKEGTFRKFCFIGYKSEDNASTAVKHFNKTYIDTSRILVEICKDLGDVSKPRAWSKYSADSSAYKKRQPKDTEAKPQGKEKKKKGKVDQLLGDLKDDEQFQEFLEVHKSRSQKALWTNDVLTAQSSEVKGQANAKLGQSGDGKGKQKMNLFDSDDSADDEEAEEEDGESESDEKPSAEAKTPSVDTTKGLSDLEYLKSKVTTSNLLSDTDDSGNDSGSDSSESDAESTGADRGEQVSDQPGEEDKPQPEPGVLYNYMVKMKGLPVNIKESQIVEFFKPIKMKSMKIPRNAKGKKDMRVATVTFESESDLEQAMRRNKNFVGQKKVFLHKIKEKCEQQPSDKLRPWELKQEKDTEELEGIDESGRLFVRNLSYFCQEADVETLFSKYGPLTEVALPLDSFTKKIKGFAYVTYMIPEHAVKAFTDLDGTIFQGRLLHILPAKQKKEPELEITDSMSYKQKKEMELKKTASSSHNWNTLFLGANAVADVMAEKYGTSKDHILSAESRQSVGVRLALGETLVVAETRDFLLEHGVVLDAFSQAAAERSKTVILAKNLPASTEGSEIQRLFSRFGTLGRLVLPPSGVTAIIEFAEPAEARAAFKNLAYTKAGDPAGLPCVRFVTEYCFKHIPLYLEWAPMGVFSTASQVPGAAKVKDKQPVKPDPGTVKPDPDIIKSDPDVKPDPDGPLITHTSEKEHNQAEPMETESQEEVATEPGSLLFVKNLNFDSTEESIKEHFGACGKIQKVTIAKKKDMKNPGKFLSMGYGFVSYMKKKSADKALKRLQQSVLDDHTLEIKISHKTTADQSVKPTNRKTQDTTKKQTSTKILVRNIPFEAKQQEVRELFSTFGELKFVRLPKKMSGTGSHRGFGFVDFLTKGDAKRAFEALCHSTHLYGRRLVLEWADEEESIEDLRQKTADHFYDGPAKKKFKKSSLMNRLNTVTKFDD